MCQPPSSSPVENQNSDAGISATEIQSPTPSNLLNKSQGAAQLMSSLLWGFFANHTVSNLAELPFQLQLDIDPLSTLLSLNRLVQNH